METICQTVCNRVISRSANPLGALKCHQLAPQARLKLLSLVGCYRWRDTKTRDPPTAKHTSGCFASNVRHRKCLWPPCEAVYAGQQVGVPAKVEGVLQNPNVHGRNGRLMHRKSKVELCVKLHFRLLKLHTRLCPPSNVGVDVWPY